MPWIVPRATLRSMSRLAWTGPKLLLIFSSSIAQSDAAAGSGRCTSLCPVSLIADRLERAGVVGVVVVDLDLAGDDAGLELRDPRLHLVRDQLGIVLVERVVDAVIGQPEVAATRLEGGVVPGAGER